MPEGDTVYLAARRLHAALAQRTLRTTDFRLPALATVDLSGRAIQEVSPYGKHLLFRLDDERTLHTHFRMDGTWHLYRTGERWRGGPAHDIRIVLTADDIVAVGYRLHDVALVPTRSEGDLVGHLGPDILADTWDRKPVLDRLAQHPSDSIAAALTNQQIVAGIGNIYRCESLFLAGLHPWTAVADIAAGDREAVLERARTLMMGNRDRASQSTTGDERRAHFVYGRAGQRCRRCGSKILAQRVDSRNRDSGAANEQRVAWCPGCQPEPGTT
ncbi:MAG TPA: DNA-formamidopyrimidine glycosylase family protein [Candidatus Nanopelagicales bacterium]|nr:DNA-formamidopyrimidine glycosylase family protein [Candidatus Nanopelagicales bacterium]